MQQRRAAYAHYDQPVDRESAYEKLKGRAAGAAVPATSPTGKLSSILLGTTGPRGGHHDGLLESAAKSAARSMGSGLGRALLRGALGSLLGTTTSRRSR